MEATIGRRAPKEAPKATQKRGKRKPRPGESPYVTIVRVTDTMSFDTGAEIEFRRLSRYPVEKDEV